jgi:hypothetical protein
MHAEDDDDDSDESDDNDRHPSLPPVGSPAWYASQSNHPSPTYVQTPNARSPEEYVKSGGEVGSPVVSAPVQQEDRLPWMTATSPGDNHDLKPSLNSDNKMEVDLASEEEEQDDDLEEDEDDEDDDNDDDDEADHDAEMELGQTEELTFEQKMSNRFPTFEKGQPLMLTDLQSIVFAGGNESGATLKENKKRRLDDHVGQSLARPFPTLVNTRTHPD